MIWKSYEQMPCVISGSDTSRLVEIIVHTKIFLKFICKNLQETMHGVPRMCEVIIKLYCRWGSYGHFVVGSGLLANNIGLFC